MEQKLESNTNLKSKFKNLYNLNKLKIFIIIGILIISVIFLIFLQINNKKRNLLISEKYVQAGIYLSLKKDDKAKELYKEIILSNNKIYSILSLNTIVEKNLITSKDKILNYFSILEKKDFNQDKLDLIKMKKGLYLIKIKEDKLGFDLLDELIKKNSNLKKIIEAIITD